MSLIQMSFSGAILILVVIVIRAVTVNRLPKTTFLVLWSIALLRLLVPFSIPFTFSVYSAASTSTVVQEVLEESPAAGLFPISTQPVIPVSEAPVSTASAAYPIWQITWIIGLFIIAAVFIISYMACLRNFRTSFPISNSFTERWLREHPIKRKISIRQSSCVSSPLTYGLIHPVILLPRAIDWGDEQQLQYIFLHEYVHIRRFDLVRKLIMIAAVCVHWFNPLVWVMYLLFNRDIELACDEQVVRRCGQTSRSAYAMALISMEETRSGPSLLCNNFSKNAIEERVIAIMKTRRFTLLGSLAACMLILCVSAGFLTSADAIEMSDEKLAPPANQTQAEPDSQTGNGGTEALLTDLTPSESQDEDGLLQKEWVWPTGNEKEASLYAYGYHSLNGQLVRNDHINIAGDAGDDVYAATDGIVVETAFDEEYGRYIVISGSDDICTIYGHLADVLVESGAQVSAGEQIGTIGSTGKATSTNLSFAVLVNGEAVDPMVYYE